jgi:hypothetical protein
VSPEPLFSSAQCSRPPNSNTAQGLKTSRSKSCWASPSFAEAPPDVLPCEETERKTTDIRFVHCDAAPIVWPGWATKKSAATT